MEALVFLCMRFLTRSLTLVLFRLSPRSEVRLTMTTMRSRCFGPGGDGTEERQASVVRLWQYETGGALLSNLPAVLFFSFDLIQPLYTVSATNKSVYRFFCSPVLSGAKHTAFLT